MRFVTVFALSLLCCLFIAADAMAQQGGGRRGQGGPGGGMFQADPFQQTLTVLGELNLRPDFTLTQDQKVKLQGIRDDVRKAEEKFREDHAADLKQIQEDMQAARQNQDREKMRDAMTKRRELMQNGPKTEDAVKQVVALLTEEQAKAYDTAMAERQQMRNRMRGGQRGQRGGGAGGAGQ